MDAAPIVLGGLGAIFGALGGLLAWSLARNVAAMDHRVNSHDATNVTHAKELADLRVLVADCVKRQAFDELRSELGAVREQNARILVLLERAK